MTGGTGFLGYSICLRLADAGHRVRVLSRRERLPEPLLDAGVTLVEGDLSGGPRLRGFVEGTEAIVHAGGLVRSDDRGRLHEVNVAGTQLVAAECRAAHSRLVHVSSAGVHGMPGGELNERSPMRPGNAYERSKVAAEAVVREQARPGWVIVRPTNVLGVDHPGDPLLRFFRAVHSGRIMVSRRAWTNYVGRSSVADAIVAVVESPDAPAELLVNDPLPLLQFARIVADVDERRRVRVIPAPIDALIGPAVEASSRRLSAMGRASALFQSTRFLTLHNEWYAARNVSLAVGPTIGELLAWYRQRALL